MRVIIFSFIALFLTIVMCMKTLRSEEKEEARTFAVLLAGERYLAWYAFQANVAHAYQVLVKNGVPTENIILFTYDDVAYDEDNPFPGKIFNEPDGPDVYAGLKIDYRGADVNLKNFIAVLEGNASATKGGNGRVLESGPNDNVFVYYSGDGASGEFFIIDEFVTALTLNKTITAMHKKKKYGKLVLYFSLCEASLLFENVLSPKINAYALSSSGANQPSAGTFCFTKDFPYICLSDEFSIAWMKNAETADLNNETLNEQFELVKKNTPRSTPQQHGDLSIGKLPAAAFFGRRSYRLRSEQLVVEQAIRDSRTQIFNSTLHNIELKTYAEYTKQGFKPLKRRSVWRKRFAHLVASLVDDPSARIRCLQAHERIQDAVCHHHAVLTFDRECARIAKNRDAAAYISVINNLCTVLQDTERITKAITNMCN